MEEHIPQSTVPDPNYEPPIPPKLDIPIASRRSTRSSSRDEEMNEDQHSKFPIVIIRTSRKITNDKLMLCIVQCLSEFKVSQHDEA